jgi:hypothetical protein
MPRAKKNSAPATEDVVVVVSAVDGSSTNQTTSFAKGNKSMSEGTIIELDMNLEDFEDFTSLPKGEYPGECTAAEVRTSDKGNQYFYTMWKIDPSDYPADYDVANNPEGTVLNFSRVQVPTASNRRAVTAVKKLYAALGLKTKTNVIDPATWVGTKAKLVVGTEKYNGEDRNSITAIENIDA